eukprot:m.66369 g.66369  ORF g.66369 m.66369 type:complete len:352 (+) comp16558_c1_seq1:251-1306(+)
MHATHNLACSIQPRNHCTRHIFGFGFCVHVQTAQGVVYDRCDLAHVEFILQRPGHAMKRRLSKLVFARAGVVIVLVERLLQLLFGHVQSRCHVRTGRIALHHTAASVVFAVPGNGRGAGLVENQPKGSFVCEHFPADIVTLPKLIAEPAAVAVQQQRTTTSQGLCCQPLYFGIGFGRVDKPSGVHLHEIHVDNMGTDLLCKFDSIACAVVAVGCGQRSQRRQLLDVFPSGVFAPVLLHLPQQRRLRKVGTKTTRGDNHHPVFLVPLTVFLINHAVHRALGVAQQGGYGGFGHNTRSLRMVFCHLLQRLDQGVCDAHAGEAFFAAVCAGVRVCTQLIDQIEVQLETVHQPLH